jgi:uncharacterized protein (TIGR00369 family)
VGGGLDLQAICASHPLHRQLQFHLDPDRQGTRMAAQVPASWFAAGEPVHGGLLATIIDTAAVFALIGATGHDWSTVDLRLDYLAPVAGARLVAESELWHIGGTIARVQCRLREAGGETAVVGVGAFRRGPRLDGANKGEG